MKFDLSPSEFARRAREANHDALGLAHDLESTVALVAVARRGFCEEQSPSGLQVWQRLVEEVIAGRAAAEEAFESAAAFERWLAREVIRLNVARGQFEQDPVHRDLIAWLPPEDGRAEARAFEMQLRAGRAAI